MKLVKKTSSLSLEELSKKIVACVGLTPADDGFIAEFHLQHCNHNPRLKIAKNPKLFWCSPTRNITSCDNRYGSTYITRAISDHLGDYTTVLGKAVVVCDTGDIWFESTDPKEASHMLLLPVSASEWSSNSWEEAEVQRHSLMYAVNDDTRWGFKRYILLELGYYYTKDENPDYEAQATYYRKLAVAELLLTGQCPENLANEFFPGLARDKVVNGCLLARSYGIKAISSSGDAKAYYAIDADGNTIPATMYRDYGNLEQELLWLDLPVDALVVSCGYDSESDKFEMQTIYGHMSDATEKQCKELSKRVQKWLV